MAVMAAGQRRVETGAWRLGRNGRRWTRFLHIVSCGAWLGIDVVMAVLVFIAFGTGSQETRALVYRALGQFAAWSLLMTGVLCLLSGILLGMGSKYGLVRYWWVAIKLALNLLLVSLVLAPLRPELAAKAKSGSEVLAGGQTDLYPGDLIYPPIVSTTCLLLATALAVFKPWGRIRRTGER